MADLLTPGAKHPILRLEHVSADADYGVEPIEDVTLEVATGEVAAVTSLDLSQSKSTLLRVAAGLLPPRAGRVTFRGRDVYGMDYEGDQRFRTRCALVTGGDSLLANRSVWENVALPLRYHQDLRGRELNLKVSRLLELTGFGESSQALPEQVSPRARRLAAFARALAVDPELVLVDRFFEDLELLDWRRLFEVVLQLNRNEGIAWLLVCDLDPLIFQVAERVGVFEGASLLDYGFRQQLYGNERIESAFLAARGTNEMRKSARMSRMRRASEAADDAQVTLNMDTPLLGKRGGDKADPQATIDLSGTQLAQEALSNPDYSPETEWERRLLEQLEDEAD